MMWEDPIVAESRALRDAYAKQFNYDRKAILEDIARRQALPGKNMVSFPPRAPVVTKLEAG
jgi:hypothetical protein